MPRPRLPGPAFEDSNPVVEDQAEKRAALEKVIESRHKEKALEREQNYEKTFENTIKVKKVLGDVDVAEEELKRLFAEVDGKEKGTELTDALDQIAKKISELEKYSGTNAEFLPIYQMRKIQLSLKGHNAMFAEKQAELQPKKKFGFKGKKSKKTEPKEQEDTAVITDLSKTTIGFNGYEVKHRTDAVIEIAPDDVNGKDVLLNGLTGCEVRLKGAPSTLHMTKLTNCLIKAGPVATSVFVEFAADTTFALACQQLRTHDARRCDFYIHVTSRAIVEDCGEVRFAPYALKYDGLDEHYKLTDLDRSLNNWAKVDDFNWLASDKASPNWSLLPEGERKAFEM